MINKNIILLVGILFIFSLPFALGDNNIAVTSCTFATGSGWYCEYGQWQHPLWSFSGQNCSQYSSQIGGVSCCPQETDICYQDGTCGGYAKYCFQYNTSYSCEHASPTAAKNSVEEDTNLTCGELNYFNITCSDYIECSCKWNSINKTCTDVAKPIRWCGGIETTNPGECTWNPDAIVNNCNNTLDNILVTKTTVWAGSPPTPSFCQKNERQYQCPPTAKLPFFGNLMLFVSVCLIIAIYFFRIAGKRE